MAVAEALVREGVDTGVVVAEVDRHAGNGNNVQERSARSGVEQVSHVYYCVVGVVEIHGVDQASNLTGLPGHRQPAEMERIDHC